MVANFRSMNAAYISVNIILWKFPTGVVVASGCCMLKEATFPMNEDVTFSLFRFGNGFSEILRDSAGAIVTSQRL